MHHFIYPSKDTYISSRPGFADKNFGIDEILQVGTTNTIVKSVSATKTYSYTSTLFQDYPVQYFVGIFTGSFNGSVVELYGNLVGNNMLTASYFSGSIDGGSIAEYSGSLSGSLNGLLSGSFNGSLWIGTFTGQLQGAEACLYGTGSGYDVRYEQNWILNSIKYIDRSLLQFDLTAISSSIANGTILSPKFHLHMKVCNEYQLPITYTIYALPISQSWNMGNGYYSDGGSSDGVSWQYKDWDDGTLWSDTYITTSRPPIDFISNPNIASQSFAYGGGTWYTSSYASQTFSYEPADINMDVTDIVMLWLSGSLPNEGLLIVSSDELQTTGSGYILKFFSRDTNTIYSPYLDVMWPGNGAGGSSDLEFITGSLTNSSTFTVATASIGMKVTVQSGSTFTIAGGVNGIFSGSTFLQTSIHYITSSNSLVSVAAQNLTGSIQSQLYTLDAEVYGTVSGSAVFTSSYFSGSIDGGIIYEVNNAKVSGSIIAFISSSLTSGSIFYFDGQVTSSLATIVGTILSGYYIDVNNAHINGFVDGVGLSGNIKGIPVVGNYDGFMTMNENVIVGPCGNSFSASFVTASLTTGIFSGSIFTAYYTDDQKFENAHLTGSWIPLSLLGSYIWIPLPSGIDPYAYAYISGDYISGTALGLYQISGSISGSVGSNSASFYGQLINGPLRGGYVNIQLSGSIYTSSYFYTSSIVTSGSVMTPLDTSRPFSVVLQNIHPSYKAGDIAKIGVFGRQQVPLKTFGISTQLQQYIIPEYLPTSSYYALKDNETGEIVIDFDNYTQISCEYPYGNYFVIDTTGVPQERFYRVLIRVENNGEIYTTDCGKLFKITR